MISGVQQPRIERAVRAVRREFFVPADERKHADEDTALPIGFKQTISQPSLVAFMTEQLAPDERSRILEIGTGSGYQTAILAELAETVFTIERLPPLAEAARERLTALGYRNIRFRIGDGGEGWPEEAPFDGIMVTASPEELPPALLAQLKPGGRMVAPVGSLDHDAQMLVRLVKRPDGSFERTELTPVRFVPLVREPPRDR